MIYATFSQLDKSCENLSRWGVRMYLFIAVLKAIHYVYLPANQEAYEKH